MPTTTVSWADPSVQADTPEFTGTQPDTLIVSETCSSKMKITNRYGLHARPATDFAQAAAGFEASVTVRHDDDEADGKSVMELMMLAATQGTEIEILCSGPDARDALSHLADLVSRGFDETDD
ncbi:MAG: HPr family phosphocarrier protein [Phycisphaerales bacterium]